MTQVACPSCGGFELNSIAPGYWRCHSYTTALEIDGFGSQSPRHVACGHEFQTAAEGSTNPLCSCGTQSIGRCSDCQRWVCGNHSVVQDGRRRCTDCAWAAYHRSSAGKRAAAEETGRDRRRAAQLQTDAERRAKFVGCSNGVELWAVVRQQGRVRQADRWMVRPLHSRRSRRRFREYVEVTESELILFSDNSFTRKRFIVGSSGYVAILAYSNAGSSAKLTLISPNSPLPPGLAEEFFSRLA